MQDQELQMGDAPIGNPTPNRRGMAIASMVLGIVSLIIVWIPLLNFIGLIAAIVGLVLGILARKSTGRKMAITGIILAIVTFVVFIVYLIVVAVLIQQAMAHHLIPAN